MKKIFFTVIAMALLSAANLFAAGPGGGAVPAGTAKFDNGNCTAKFVRSASGIVNETNRTCTYTNVHNGVTYSGVYLQFRPLTGTPNPACDPVGLIDSWSPFATNETTISKWFKTDSYQVCVYLDAVTGNIDVTDAAGSTTDLQISGNYSVCIQGTYDFQGTFNPGAFLADANYVTEDNWITPLKTLPSYPELGVNFGNVQIDHEFVDWGPFSVNHNYCLTVHHDAGTMNLRPFDSEYSDNTGGFSYVVKYLGN